MQDGLFKNWLSNVDDRPTAQVSDNLSRARRVERAGFDLDIEYDRDQCKNVLDLLSLDNPSFLLESGLPTDSAGLSSLKTSVRKYIKFRDYL